MKQIQNNKTVNSKKKRCIWEQTGITKRDECQEKFQCEHCEFDIEMRDIAQANKQLLRNGKKLTGKNKHVVFWKDKLRELPAGKSPCQHYLKQQIPHRICTNDYNCQNCSFDQYFYDQFKVHAVIKPIDVLDIEGIKIPQGYYYHFGHVWVKLEENSEVRIGVDDFTYHLLGPPDRIEVPLIGKELTQDQADIVFTRGENTARLLSPVNGIVTAINSSLREDAMDAYMNPYTDGWLMRVHVPELRQNLKSLMMGDEIKKRLISQVDELFSLIDSDDQPLAADGGNLQRDVYGSLPGIGWDRLVNTFFS